MFLYKSDSWTNCFPLNVSWIGETGSFSKNTDWIFCSCRKPAQKYISLTNVLSIRNVYFDDSSFVSKIPLENAASYEINYRFVDAEFEQNEKVIRVVQDTKTLSAINGYLLRVRVPANNHLRLFGKSNKVKFSFISFFFIFEFIKSAYINFFYWKIF